MTDRLNDPMGQAILDYANSGTEENIIVSSEICDDDIIPASYLFRPYEEMPKLEQLALRRVEGKTLDIGAAAGMHLKHLEEEGIDAHAIDISERAVQHLKSIGLSAEVADFFDYRGGTYDTLLLLMNGIGIAKSLDNLESMLVKAKSLLNENGKILCDSSDIKYLYEDDEGGMWVDLNTTYYGNFRFQMKYKEHTSDWFDWLYVDFDKLQEIGSRAGFNVTKLYEEENQYLAELTLL